MGELGEGGLEDLAKHGGEADGTARRGITGLK